MVNSMDVVFYTGFIYLHIHILNMDYIYYIYTYIQHTKVTKGLFGAATELAPKGSNLRKVGVVLEEGRLIVLFYSG